MLTKNNFRQLNEADLRKEILIPLFRAMGYKDVYEYHGGAGEQGKDIVCWKLDELGSRENLALVVKATQMTGKAQVNKGTAGEVQTQIRQCFGSPYIDPVSGDDQSVHRVWVVSNKKISKESINAIKSAVANPDLMRNVRFIDGDTLWGLIETHLPLSMWHFIEETRKRVGTSDSHYEPQIQITGDRTSVTLVEKFPGASEEKPITINTKFHFPSKKDAEMFEASFKKHLETGEPLDIPSDIIGEVDVPDFVQALLGVGNIKLHSMQFLPAPKTHRVAVQINFLCNDGDNFTLSYVLLRVAQGGTKEMTLVNDEQDIPFHVKLVLRHETQSGNFSVRPRSISFNVVQYLDFLKLYTCLSKPLRVEVIHLESGIKLFEMHQENGSVEPPDPRFVALIDDLAIIQRAVKKTFIIPERDFTRDELRLISELSQIVTQGRIEGKWDDFVITLVLDPENLDSIIATFNDGQVGNLMVETEEVECLFDIEIPLGRVRHIIQSAKLENIEELHTRYEELRSSKTEISLMFIPGKNAKVINEYLDWRS